MITVSIIGIGRVGGALALSLPKSIYKVENLIARIDPAKEFRDFGGISVTSINEISSLSSDVVFIATPDPSIEEVASELLGRISSDQIVFHTSGSNSSEVLSGLRSVGARIGSLHPLVSISKPEFGPERFNGAYFCVEGDPEAVTIAEQIVSDIGGKSFEVESRFKILYHAAAVTACGHLVALLDASFEMMNKCGLSTDQAKDILMPLVSSTISNLQEQTTAEALTGTFARADIETFTKHLGSLNDNVSDELLEIYLLLGERSLELAARQGVSSERIEKLRAKVSVAKSKMKW